MTTGLRVSARARDPVHRYRALGITISDLFWGISLIDGLPGKSLAPPLGPSPNHTWTFVISNRRSLGIYYQGMASETEVDTTPPEKRRWRRLHFAVPIQVTIEKPQHVTLTDARGWRMNDGGTAVYADTELSIGSEAEIAFTPPHFYPPVTLRGVIRNRAGDLYGVEFLAKSAAEKEQLGLFRQILARWNAAAW